MGEKWGWDVSSASIEGIYSDGKKNASTTPPELLTNMKDWKYRCLLIRIGTGLARVVSFRRDILGQGLTK